MDVDLESIDITDVSLIVVDAQTAFASETSPLADRGVDMAPMIETVTRLRTLLSSVRDAAVPIAFTRLVRRADGKDAPRTVYDVCPGIYRDGEPICCEGSPETAFLEGIEPLEDEYAVEKQRYDAFVGTDLDRHLRTESVSTVLIAGFATNVCVESTVRSAHERGYDALVIENCCSAFDERAHRSAIDNVESYFGGTLSLEGAIGLLSA
ncbi:cysteine hydrolase family protein [Natronorubrum sp. FCH18a]|uniref:cysteine hydrolase family protein n=1 Tax=Natronorubrum sp. FCH18a TaxID=3447018 RepID=UPI003F50F226